MNKSCYRIIAFCWPLFAASVHATEGESALVLQDSSEERNAHFLLSYGRSDIKGDVFHHQGTISKIQGGYRFSDFIMFEAGFVFYGQSDDEAGTAEQEITGAAIEGQLFLIAPLLSWFEPYGKLGASSWLFDVTEQPGIVDSGSGNFESTDLIYGAGILFHVDHDSTLRLEYEVSTFKDSDFDVDVKVISFGIHHRF